MRIASTEGNRDGEGVLESMLIFMGSNPGKRFYAERDSEWPLSHARSRVDLGTPLDHLALSDSCDALVELLVVDVPRTPSEHYGLRGSYTDAVGGFAVLRRLMVWRKFAGEIFWFHYNTWPRYILFSLAHIHPQKTFVRQHHYS